MQPEIIRIYKSLHTWTGILSGLALFIAFYAGAITTFKEPVTQWASPPTAGVNAISIQQTPSLINQVLAAEPDVEKGFFIHLNDVESTVGRIEWEGHEEGADDHDELSTKHYTAVLDENGDIKIEPTSSSKLGIFIDVIHRVVGLPFDIDATRWVMGIVAILYSLALVSGLIIFLPTLAKDLFALRLGKNLKRMWLDAHNVVGFISLPFHLIMALTAISFAYHDFFYVAQDKTIHNGGLRAAFTSALASPDPTPKDPTTMLTPEALIEQAKSISPSFTPTMLQYANITSPRPMVRVWGNDPTSMGGRAWGGFAVINPYSGDILNVDYMPVEQATAFAAISSFFALHFATYGGAPVKWVYFILALAGAWLFYTGNLLWIESRRKRQKRNSELPDQRKDTKILACLTVGICLGCISGLSLTIAASKWLSVYAPNLHLQHHWVYYSVFFSSIIWAFMAGAAKASTHLLSVAALTTLAIPLTSLFAFLIPSLGMWTHLSISSLGVDLTALVGSACYAYIALRVAKRMKHATKDSVWTKPESTQT